MCLITDETKTNVGTYKKGYQADSQPAKKTIFWSWNDKFRGMKKSHPMKATQNKINKYNEIEQDL